MAIAGSNRQLMYPHQLFNMMNPRGSPVVQRSNTNNNHQGNGQHQRGDQNNGNNGNGNGNGNRNHRDNRNNDDRRPPADSNRSDDPIGGVMTEERKTHLKGLGFLVAQGRYITFVHKFSGYNNKGMCNHFSYKNAAYNRTDSGTCRFPHIKSFQSLPAFNKNVLKAWLRDTPGVSFVDGRGPTNSGLYIITSQSY